MRPRSRASRRSPRPVSGSSRRTRDQWTSIPSPRSSPRCATARSRTSRSATTPAALEAVESAYLGRKGELRTLLGGIGQLPGEDRPRVGALANPVREAARGRHQRTRRERLRDIELEVRLAAERIDVTLPGRPLWRGSLHPMRETEHEIARVFGQFGFVIYEGPEVETDELNFQLLNIPEDHPARDLWDTIYVARSATREVATGRPPAARRRRSPAARGTCCARTRRRARSG